MDEKNKFLCGQSVHNDIIKRAERRGALEAYEWIVKALHPTEFAQNRIKELTKDRTMSNKELAKRLHNKYEKLAKEAGWTTQEDCQTEFEDLPYKNKQVMVGMAKFVRKLKFSEEIK